MDEKRDSLYQRLINVSNAGLIQSTVVPESRNTSSQSLSISLLDNYVKSRDAYLKLCNIVDIPVALKYPYCFFYSKNGSIFTIDYFSYGTTCKSNKLTQKTFPALLTNVFNIPYISGDILTQFYISLYILIRDFPRNTLQTITNQIRQFSPVVAVLLDSVPSSFYVTSEGNLLFDSYAISQKTSGRRSRYQSALSFFSFLEEYCGFQQEQLYVPSRLLKQYFSTFKRERNNFFSQYSIDKESPTEILFASKQGSTNISVKYDAITDSFTHSKISEPVVNLKTSFIEKRKTMQVVSCEVKSFFQHLCASDILLVEKLAQAFANTISPRKGGMTILLTQLNETCLEDMMCMIFENDIVSFSKKPSINKIVKAQYLMDLFLAQSQNKSLVFMRDILPSEANIKTFRRILNGRAISVKSNFLPNQQYNNHLHFLCITSDRTRAKYLQKKFKATLIDFSPTETQISSSVTFSKEDIHWFRTTFTLYGLKLQTLRSANLPDPSPFPLPIPSTSPSLDEELHQFLYGCCEIDPNSFCNTEEVYSWYNQFFQITHPGKKPVWSKIQFNKHLRELIAEEHKKNITYKRDRHSRSASSKYGYQGLKLSSILSSKEIDQQIHNNLLHDYLDYVSRYDIEFKDIMEVRVLKE